MICLANDSPTPAPGNVIERRQRKNKSIFQMLKLVLEGVVRTDISHRRKRKNSEEIYDSDGNLVSE